MRSEQAVTNRTQLALSAVRGVTQGGASRTSLRLLLITIGALSLLLLSRWGLQGHLPGGGGVPTVIPPEPYTFVSTVGAIVWPVDVALDDRGWLYVSDRDSASVVVFDRDRREVGRLGRDGQGAFLAPMGVAVSAERELFVADWRQRAILTFNEEGYFTGLFGEGELASGDRAPAGLFVTETHLYVTDIALHQVLVFRIDGSLERVVGLGEGSGIGELRYPNAVWVTQDGNLWVADTSNDRIQRFAPDGTPLGVWGPPIGSPRDLIVEGGQVYVASALSNRIVVMDATGRRMHEITTSDVGGLMAPTGLALSDRHIYGTDRLVGGVHEWRRE